MGGIRDQYTINIVDTGIFWSLGKSPNSDFNALGEAVQTAEQTLVLTHEIYRELGGRPESNPPPSDSEYVAPGIDQGWIEVAGPLESSEAKQAAEAAKKVITNFMDHPKTACADEDASLVGLAVQHFDENKSLDIIIHTTDLALAKGASVVISELGYYDFTANFIPPQKVSEEIISASQFTR